MSITEHAGIAWEDVVETAERTVERLENAPRYAVEEYTTSDPPHVTTADDLASGAPDDDERGG